MNEKEVEKLYRKGTKLAEKRLKSKGATDNVELDTLCRKEFKDRFLGVFSQDTIPWEELNKKESCCIFNLDLKGEPGSHWCALYTSPDEKYPILYDSFGRRPRILLRRTKDKRCTKKVLTTESDAEQDPSEENCGHRCFGFLYMCRKVQTAESIFLL